MYIKFKPLLLWQCKIGRENRKKKKKDEAGVVYGAKSQFISNWDIATGSLTMQNFFHHLLTAQDRIEWVVS